MPELFDGLRVIVHRSLEGKVAAEMMDALCDNGAREAESEKEATHIVTDSYEVGIDMDKEGKRIHLVTPTWVRRCLALGMRQEERFYSPDPRMLFSGIVGCSSDLPRRDAEVIQAGIVGLGGQWRGPLTKEVTHLFVLSPTGDKYETALKHQHRTKMKIVLPHWFDDSFKAAHLVPTRMYEFPNPPLLAPDGITLEPWKHDEKQSQLYKSLQYSKPDQDMTKIPSRHKDLFKGQRIRLSESLQLPPQRKQAFEARIRDAGGVIVETASAATTLITPFQEGHEFYSAFKKGKMIGTLEWLVYVLREGRISNPREQLMHFPHPKGPCGSFANYEITVTNYSGPSRDYVKLLIETLGAKFTPTMSGSNTHVIAGYCPPNEPVSAKVARAHEWRIPVINHLWLEDCFASWREVPISGTKYAMRNIELNAVLGDKKQVEVHIPKEELEANSESETEPELSPVKSGRSAKSAASNPTTPRKLNGRAATNGDVDMDETEPPQPEDEDEVDRLVTNEPFDTPTTSRPRRNGTASRTETPKRSQVPATSSPTRISESASSKRQISSPSKSDRPAKRTRASSPASRTPRTSPHKNQDDYVPSEAEEVEEVEQTQQPPRRSPRKATESAKSALQFIPPPSPSADSDLPDDPMEGVAVQPAKKATPAKANPASIRHTRQRSAPTSALTEDEAMSESPGPSRAQAALSSRKRAKRNSSPGLPASDMPSSSALASTSFDGRPRRSAAVAAEKSLHEAMEDANKFSREIRHKGHLTDLGRVKVPVTESAREDVIELSGDSEEEAPARRQSKDAANGRKVGRPRKESKENEPVQPKRTATQRQTGRRGTGTKSVSADSDDEVEEAPKPTRPASRAKKAVPGRADSKASRRTETPKPQIKAITTQVVLTPQEQRAIEALGVTIIADPRECTHVIAKGISRTEKFLVAMANAPKIVTKDWILKSIEQGQLLPEDPFLVKDAEKEADYSFKLQDALARAAKRPLMQGHRFHITPSVKVDFHSLKKIIEACGGRAIKVMQPLTKELGEKQHLISCAEDEKYWRALADEGTLVYTQELVLTGALKQEMGWKDKGMLVEGSAAK